MHIDHYKTDHMNMEIISSESFCVFKKFGVVFFLREAFRATLFGASVVFLPKFIVIYATFVRMY